METSTDLRYPVGKYEPNPFSADRKEEWIADIKFLPNLLEAAISNLDEAQLQTPYRPGGWTVHQVVHHVADSHMNAYIRFKLGMTEENPTIKPYEENDWAQLEDVRVLPVNISITLLFALHERWTVFLKSITDEDWQRRTVFHPEHQKEMTLWHLLGMYAWHSRHHTAHVTALRGRMGWK
ncbi:MAG: putative metal-dependent hydrolase [Chitinophagaceae bacterium]|nr:MAG: putative metal-dependent hydrolase [Chitinophagaceae bacterium]